MQWYYHTGVTYNPSLLVTAPQIADGSLTSWVSNDYTRPVGASAIQVWVWGVAALDSTDGLGTAVAFSWDTTNYPCSINDQKWQLLYNTVPGSAGFAQTNTGWVNYKNASLGIIPTATFTTSIPIVGAATAARAWRIAIEALTDDPTCPGWTTPAQGVAQARLYDFLPGFTTAGCVTPGTAVNLTASLSCCGGNAGIGWSGAQSAATYSVYEYVPGLAPAYALLTAGIAGTAYTATIPASEKTNQHIFQIIPTNGCGDGLPTAVTIGPKFAVTQPTCPVFAAGTATCPTYSAGVAATPVYSAPTCTR